MLILIVMSSRVLVADDSAVVRVALVRRFKSAGLEVVEAASVAEAKRVDPATVDLAVLDFDLGDGYGSEIAEHLVTSRSDLPVCFFTTSTKDAEERAAPYGPIFAKPDQTDDLLGWVLAQVESASTNGAG